MKGTTLTGYPFNDACESGPYTWTVQSYRDGDDTMPGLPTEGTYTITVDPPVLLWPTNGESDIDPTAVNVLKWTNHYAPEDYQLNVLENGAFFLGAGTSDQTYSIVKPLKPSTTYTWTVSVTDPVSHETAVSPTSSFTTIAKCADVQRGGRHRRRLAGDRPRQDQRHVLGRVPDVRDCRPDHRQLPVQRRDEDVDQHLRRDPRPVRRRARRRSSKLSR